MSRLKLYEHWTKADQSECKGAQAPLRVLAQPEFAVESVNSTQFDAALSFASSTS